MFFLGVFVTELHGTNVAAGLGRAGVFLDILEREVGDLACHIGRAGKAEEKAQHAPCEVVLLVRRDLALPRLGKGGACPQGVCIHAEVGLVAQLRDPVVLLRILDPL